MQRVTAFAVLTLATVVLGCAGRQAPPPKDVGPPKVTVATPLVSPVTEFTDLTGTLAPIKTADVRARVSGYVQKVLFKEGSEVKSGDPLIEIDPEPFRVALGIAETGVKTAQAQQGQAAATEARLAKAIAAGVGSAEEYDQAKAALLVAKAAIEKAQEDVKQAKLNLGYTTVVAPFDGRVDRIFVNEGNVVTGGSGQGTVLTRIVTTDPIYAYFTIDEQAVLSYLRRIAREGRSASAQGGVPVEIQLRDETGYPHKGHIDFASSELNPSTGTLQIRGAFDNPGPPRLLRPGLYVRGRIPLSAATQATLVPDGAVVTDQAQRVVYVVGSGNRVAAKPVTLGPQALGLRVVEGLTPTDRVIINGLARIQPDMEIDPQPGEIKPQPDPQPTGPTPPTAPNGNPGQGAQPGAGGNAAPGGDKRDRPPMTADPQK